jgi:hypothetical protein
VLRAVDLARDAARTAALEDREAVIDARAMPEPGPATGAEVVDHAVKATGLARARAGLQRDIAQRGWQIFGERVDVTPETPRDRAIVHNS